MPSAAVLATELLRHDQLGTHDEALPRSEIIQQLSVLVSALEGVQPDDGNRSTCELGMVAIKKVLDRLLSPKQLIVPQAEASAAGAMETLFPSSNDTEFLSWLNNVDFDADHWLNNL